LRRLLHHVAYAVDEVTSLTQGFAGIFAKPFGFAFELFAVAGHHVGGAYGHADAGGCNRSGFSGHGVTS